MKIQARVKMLARLKKLAWVKVHTRVRYIYLPSYLSCASIRAFRHPFIEEQDR